MDVALLGLVGVVVGAAIGSVGGYLTARQQGRHAVELERVRAQADRQRQITDLALELARLQLEHDPGNPNSPADHVAVLLGRLRELDDAGVTPEAVTQFRRAVLSACATSAVPSDAEGPSLAQTLLMHGADGGLAWVTPTDLISADAALGADEENPRSGHRIEGDASHA
jgi:hypothetical protein